MKMKKFISKNWLKIVLVLSAIIAITLCIFAGKWIASRQVAILQAMLSFATEPVAKNFFTIKIIAGFRVYHFIFIIFIISVTVYAIILRVNSIVAKRKEKIADLNKQKELEKKQKAEEEKKSRFYKIFVSLANDIQISEEDLVYLSKNLSFPNEFPIAKLVRFDFKKLFVISNIKCKVIWHHDLEEILRMYNSFYKNETDDKKLHLLINVISNIYHLWDELLGYNAHEPFKKMVKKTTSDMTKFWQEEEKTL